ncbi:hypothetical protein HGRIS_013989 [Hohenbuehelia grisea]|uniref:Uncharacterized protein n=1 Tax=Hohenbuehelia grisea TaxID=104357 RepID=A0ABR3JSZ7_9AGAR
MEIAPKRRLGSKSHLAVPTFQIHNLAPAPNRNPGVNSCYSKLDFGSRSPNTLLSKVQLVHRELCRSPACSLSSKLLSGGSSFSSEFIVELAFGVCLIASYFQRSRSW